MMGCSIDGMINMFDLTMPNEEDAFQWGFKIIESPLSFTMAANGFALVQTLDHNLYKVHDGDHFGKVSPNNIENPKHIICSALIKNSNPCLYEYCTWSPE